MQLTQNKMGLALIEATLYKHQPWYPSGTLTKAGFVLRKASTYFLNELVVIDFTTPTIVVNGHRTKLKKETATDLVTLVRLKITKKLKNVRTK